MLSPQPSDGAIVRPDALCGRIVFTADNDGANPPTRRKLPKLGGSVLRYDAASGQCVRVATGDKTRIAADVDIPARFMLESILANTAKHFTAVAALCRDKEEDVDVLFHRSTLWQTQQKPVGGQVVEMQNIMRRIIPESAA